jgi:hypothetical protein
MAANKASLAAAARECKRNYERALILEEQAVWADRFIQSQQKQSGLFDLGSVHIALHEVFSAKKHTAAMRQIYHDAIDRESQHAALASTIFPSDLAPVSNLIV